MKEPFKCVWLVVACFAVGCGSDQTPPTAPPALTPLSVADWRGLPFNEKDDEATFDRLKLQDHKLKDDRAWHRFMVETVNPERKTDLPDDLPG